MNSSSESFESSSTCKVVDYILSMSAVVNESETSVITNESSIVESVDGSSINSSHDSSSTMEVWRNKMEEAKKRNEILQNEFDTLKTSVEKLQDEKTKLNDEIQKSKNEAVVITEAFKVMRELIKNNVGKIVGISEQMLTNKNNVEVDFVPRRRSSSMYIQNPSSMSSSGNHDIIMPVPLLKNNHQTHAPTSSDDDEIVDNDIEY